MKILIVGQFAELVDLCIHLQEEGHEVFYYYASKTDEGVGKGLVNIVKGWKQYAEEADLIFFADVYFGDLPVEFREKGKLVVGGSVLSEKLENDREFATKIWEKFGLKFPKTYRFSSFEEAIQFVRKNPDRYVIKMQGQKARYLTYVSEGPEDVILTLKHYSNVLKGKPDFLLQKYIEGTEVAVTGLFNGEKFLKPVIVNFEHKRLGNGDRGPLCGEMGTVIKPMMKSKLAQETIQKVIPFLKLAEYRGFFDLNTIVREDGVYILEATCFSEDTEILTISGWKGVNDIYPGEIACCMKEDGSLSFGVIEEIKIFKYDGPMVFFWGRNFSLPVTPDHTMLTANYDRVPASFFLQKDKFYLPLSFDEKTQEKETFTLPAVKTEEGVLLNEIEVNINDLAFLLGAFYGGEGEILDPVNILLKDITTDGSCRKRLEEVLVRLPFRYHIEGTCLILRAPQLIEYLRSLGKKYPGFVFCNGKKTAQSFLEGFFNSSPRKKGNYLRREAYCANEDLATFLELVYMVAGYSPFRYSDREIRKLIYGSEPQNIPISCNEEHYSGYVWCPSVFPHRTVIAKKKGSRPIITGQCRPGIPTIHIMDGLMKGKWSELLLAIAEGRDIIAPFAQDWCVGVVVVSPPWPIESRSEKFEDYPIFIDPQLHYKRKIHLGDVKVEKIEEGYILTTAGSIGFSLVATGVGKSIEEAQEEVYKRVLPKIKFPLGWYRTDIGDRVLKSLKFLKKMDYIE